MSRPQPSPEEWFHQVATHYVLAQILYNLNQTGVFRLLDEGGPLPVQDIAQQLDLTPSILQTLLDYVVGVEHLLEADDSGRIGIAPFGREVLRRYERRNANDVHFNFFDVRVGAYGPVWADLGKLLRGARYGQDVKRTGEHAADAVYKFVVHLEPTFRRLMDQYGCGSLVEIGTSTGLLERLGGDRPDMQLFAVDRSTDVLDALQQRAEAAGVARVHRVESDLFDARAWATALAGAPKGIIFSLHLHEFLAEGDDAWIEVMRELAATLPGWRVIFFEQPLMPQEARARFSEVQWMSVQSNVLIHHLIANGRILPEAHLTDIFARAGCPAEHVEDCDYIGFKAFVVPL